MKIRSICKLFTLQLLLALCVQAGAQTLRAGLDSLIEEAQSELNGNLGIAVWDAQSDSLLYSRDGQRLHHPASTLKVLTAVSALNSFGPDYQFRTSVRQSGSNLFVVGSFDPLFSMADLRNLAAGVKQSGITEVNWLYADVSLKDTLSRGPGWCWDDTGNDSPVLSPLLVDGEPGFIHLFRDQLEQLGIRVNKVMTSGICPAGAAEVACVRRPIMDVLVPCLKMSVNLYAEALLYQHARLYPGVYDSSRNAVSVERQLLQQLGIGPTDCEIVDGSGLSYYNCMSAEQQVAILRYAYQHENIYRALRQALPIGGQDGTLNHRMSTVPLFGNVYAKTGSISSVNALCGYLYVPRNAPNPLAGHTLMFSILVDGIPPRRSADYRALQERLLLHLAAASYCLW